MKKSERVRRLINRETVDYLPSQITFADRTRNKEIANVLGLKNEDELDDYLENHLELPFMKYDMPLFLRNDLDLMKRLQAEEVVGLDEDGKTVYDIWGMGIRIGEDGFYYNYSPFQGNKEGNKRAKPFLPPSFNIDLLDMEPKQAVKEFVPPDPTAMGNMEVVKEEIDRLKDDICVIPCGYFGIWERANGMLGFSENLSYFAFDPDLAYEMLKKITDYKVKVAHELIKMGQTICHHGDDLGFQTSTFFSREMFQNIVLPHLKRLFKVYKDANVKIMYHSCGNITKLLPDLIESGIDILEPVQPCMDLKYLKNNFGDALIFMGGIDTQRVLPFGSPEDVKQHAREVIRILGRGGGYIIAPSQEIMKDVPVENIVALIETIKEERELVLDL